LILASEGLAQRCETSTIDPEPRGKERPSDHTPVLAIFP
jgi:exodeoxyribonuclease-3